MRFVFFVHLWPMANVFPPGGPVVRPYANTGMPPREGRVLPRQYMAQVRKRPTPFRELAGLFLLAAISRL